jgi:hypothetical protein
MAIGSVMAVAALVFIGWTQEIVYSFVNKDSPIVSFIY